MSRKLSILLISVFVHPLFLLISSDAWARPVDKGQAEKVARGWLRQNERVMDRAMGEYAGTDVYTDEQGQVLYYVVHLEPAGFAVLSADDEVEPVIAFSAGGRFDDDPENPLKVMLEKDMRGRQAAIQEEHPQIKTLKRGASAKWEGLLRADDEPEMAPAGIGGISQVYVEPFLQTAWDQGNVGGSACYNYYTPFNFSTGCVATAMAQVMRYYSYPTLPIGVHSFTIRVDGVSQTASTRGGNGTGGAYDWGLMPINPQLGVSAAERQMIGSLCYDAGVTVEMSYRSSGSSASLQDAKDALRGTFLYGGGVYTQSFTFSGDERLWNLLNANLDAKMPVILSISRTNGGHAVVADGYGYNGQTLYHHINLGWGGADNAWYQLPTIDTSTYSYTLVDGAVYNVYTIGSGEIISGRVTTPAGAPLAGVTVRAYWGSSFVKQAVTDSRGIYALTQLASGRTYRVSPVKTGETFVDQNVTVGSSTDYGTPGNRSGIDFVSAAFGPPTAFDVQAQVNSTDSVRVELQALDDGQPDPDLLHYIITSLPAHGRLSEPNVGPIETVPYAIVASHANGIDYRPCPYFGGVDTFTYKANDGGTYPTGGDSNIATVTVTVNNRFNTDFGVESNTYSTFLMKTASYYDVRAEVILLQSDIGPAQRLTDLAFDVYIIPGRTLSNWTIRMQHTNWTAFTNPASMFLTTGWTTVFQSNQTITGTGWHNFHFSTPFVYNGTQNLLIDFSYNNSGLSSPAGGYMVNTAVGKDRFLALASTTGAHGDPLQWDLRATGGSYFTGSVPSMKMIGEVSLAPLAGDFDATCSVGLSDLAILAQAWQSASGQANYDPDCDLTASKGTVNMADLLVLADHWLERYPY